MTEAKLLDYLNEYHNRLTKGTIFQNSSNPQLEEQKLLIKDFIKTFKLENSIDAILNERAKTHGDFKDHALIARMLKNVFWKTNNELTFTQSEAIDMILHKVARIGAGNPNEIDHWRDISGYATLVVKELSNEQGRD